MPKNKWRINHDLRRIKTSRTYKLSDLARALKVSVASVQRWLRQGLPSIDDAKPVMISGRDAKIWLKARRANRKSKCKINQFYCFGCRVPSSVKADSVRTNQKGSKSVHITGQCAKCGTMVSKVFSVGDADTFLRSLKTAKLPKHLLRGNDKSSPVAPKVKATNPQGDLSQIQSQLEFNLFDWAQYDSTPRIEEGGCDE